MRFGHVVWEWVMVIFRWLCFIFVHRSHRKRGIAVVPQISYLILAVVPWDSSTQHLVRHAVGPSLGSSAFTSTSLLPMASEVYLENNLIPSPFPYKFLLSISPQLLYFLRLSGSPYLCFIATLKAFCFYVNLGLHCNISKSIKIFYFVFLGSALTWIYINSLLHLKHR